MKKVVPFIILFILILSVLTVFFPTGICETAEDIEWEQTFGETDITEKGVMVIQTDDDGYLILADTIFSEEGGGLQSDIWLIKTNQNGILDWDKTFARPDDFYIRNGKYVEQTSDGGYIVIVEGQNYGLGEYPYLWLIKLNSNGNKEWDVTLSNTDFQVGKQVSDGGYIVGGEGFAAHYPRLHKIDKNGGVEWSNDYYFNPTLTSFLENDDQQYLVTTEDGDLFMIDNDGSVKWQKSLSYSNLKICEQISNGEYIMIGTTRASEGLIYMPPDENICLLKFDNNGDITWNKTVGYYDRDDFTLWQWSIDASELSLATYEPRFSLKSANEEGYLFLAKRWSYYPGMGDAEYKSPLWIVKNDEDGNEEWHATLEDAPAESVQPTNDGGLILVGLKSEDIWLMKVSEEIQNENQPPIVEISSPSDEDIVSGTITISGTASDTDGSIQLVQIKITDGSSWLTVDGTKSWSYSWNTTTYPEDGYINIYARSYDGIDYSLLDSIKVAVNQSIEPATDDGSNGGEKTPGFELILVILTITLALFWNIKRMK